MSGTPFWCAPASCSRRRGCYPSWRAATTRWRRRWRRCRRRCSSRATWWATSCSSSAGTTGSTPGTFASGAKEGAAERALSKDALLREMEAGFADLLSTVDGLSEEQMTRVWYGDWSVRDILAHVAGWAREG